MTIEVRNIDVSNPEEHSVIRVGKVGRADPASEIHIYTKDEDGEWMRLKRYFVDGDKMHKETLAHGAEYHVAVVGDKTAGFISTAGHKVIAPFNVFLDPPEDHNKDFFKISVPANRPVTGELERMIKAIIK